ncbi:MAG: hypothetical protein WBP45_13990 [Daejeonella sp.]
MKYILILFVVLMRSFPVIAQHAETDKDLKILQGLTDSLKTLSYKIVNAELEPERYNANYAFIKTLVSTLKTPNSFNLEFDSLKSVSILTSPDKRFKIFSWPVMNANGSYRYYGTIQMNNANNKLELFPLVDYSAAIKTPQDTITSNDKWYGAQYYKIIPVANAKTPYYILLGWKGNTIKSTKKVIEVLYFKDGKAVFGMPVFDGDKEHANSKRIIFEYTRKASMVLNYDVAANLILFDHLAPPDPKFKDQYEFWGPDFSYDGYKLVNGRLSLVTDIKLKNLPSNMDNQYNNPKKLKNKTSVKNN